MTSSIAPTNRAGRPEAEILRSCWSRRRSAACWALRTGRHMSSAPEVQRSLLADAAGRPVGSRLPTRDDGLREVEISADVFESHRADAAPRMRRDRPRTRAGQARARRAVAPRDDRPARPAPGCAGGSEQAGGRRPARSPALRTRAAAAAATTPRSRTALDRAATSRWAPARCCRSRDRSWVLPCLRGRMAVSSVGPVRAGWGITVRRAGRQAGRQLRRCRGRRCRVTRDDQPVWQPPAARTRRPLWPLLISGSVVVCNGSLVGRRAVVGFRPRRP